MSLQRPSSPKGRFYLLLAVVLSASLLGDPGWLDTASAQSAIQAVLERHQGTSPAERAELYRQLNSQAEVLEKQAAVVKTVAKLMGPTVVHIEADITASSPRQGRGFHREEAGAGVIVEINNKHYILTNRHVITGADPEDIRIRLADGRQISPTKTWQDPDTDVAVMAVETTGLTPAPVGDSDRMEIGDFVLAVGSPFGLSHSVTYGIISAKGRHDLDLDDAGVRYQNFLQTDAAINPGNSGGPLVNLRGEVIGINTAIASNSGGSEGIGFAIPVNVFMVVAKQFVQRGSISRGLLGVTLDGSFGSAMAAEIGLPRPMGARVTAIIPDSPAEAADLRVGDVILQYDDTPVDNDNHLVTLVKLTDLDEEVSLLIFRNQQPIRIKVSVGNGESRRLDK